MNYEAAELEIKVRLENATGSPAGLPDKYSIYVLPDNDDEFEQNLPQADEVKIGVVYRGSHFEVPDSTDYIVQDEIMTFEINVMATKRRGQYGALAAKEYIRSKVLGFKSPSGYFDRLEYMDEVMLSFVEGIWQWSVIAKGNTRINQDIDYDPTPNITMITANSDLGTTVTVPNDDIN